MKAVARGVAFQVPVVMVPRVVMEVEPVPVARVAVLVASFQVMVMFDPARSSATSKPGVAFLRLIW